jgi:hypothetical protein
LLAPICFFGLVSDLDFIRIKYTGISVITQKSPVPQLRFSFF